MVYISQWRKWKVLSEKKMKMKKKKELEVEN